MSLTLCQISYCCLPTAHSNCETVSTFHCTDKQTHCFTSLHNCLWPFSRDSHIHQNYMLLPMLWFVMWQKGWVFL